LIKSQKIGNGEGEILRGLSHRAPEAPRPGLTHKGGRGQLAGAGGGRRMSRGIGRFQRRILQALADNTKYRCERLIDGLKGELWEREPAYVEAVNAHGSTVRLRTGWRFVGDRANLHRALDSLEARGLIRRYIEPRQYKGGRLYRVVALTEAGHKALQSKRSDLSGKDTP
jgi:hypothetical protein